jgi:PAS domain S-box-containing protein
MLAGQISIPSKAGLVLESVEAFIRLDPKVRIQELPRIYLLLEQYLTDLDPVRTLTRADLRERTRSTFSGLTDEPSFRIVFESPERQELLLCRSFLLEVLDRGMHVLGEGSRLSAVKAWIRQAPVPATGTSPLAPFAGEPSSSSMKGFRGPADLPRPANDTEWMAALVAASPNIFEQLHVGLGEATARIYDGAYTEMANRYGGLETFPTVVRLLPDGLLDAERIQSVARHGTMVRVQGALSEARRSALESATQLQAVLNTVGEGIATVDAERRLVLVNREIERMFGYGADELLERELSLLLEDSEDVFFGSVGKRIAVAGRRRDGSTFPVEVCVNETLISGRRFYTAAMRDVTTRQRYERGLVKAKEHAEEMTRLKTAFLANMSHEFRTPLAGIMGAVGILDDEIPEPLQEFVGIIAESGRRLLATFDSVLEFALLESGDRRVHLRSFAVTPRLTAAVERFGARAKAKGLGLWLEPPSSTEHPGDGVLAGSNWAHADPECLDRVLDRLLENAIRFTYDGSVRVRTHSQDGRVWIEIRDTGIGIGHSFLPHAFDEFRQESSGDARLHEGTGLGLAIARRLAAAMGGSLEAESTPGSGSTFLLSLNAAESCSTARKRQLAAPRRELNG